MSSGGAVDSSYGRPINNEEDVMDSEEHANVWYRAAVRLWDLHAEADDRGLDFGYDVRPMAKLCECVAASYKEAAKAGDD